MARITKKQTNKINTAIAKIQGWTSIKNVSGDMMGRPPNTTDSFVIIPDYYNDLNLCHELEKTLTPLECIRYRDIIHAIILSEVAPTSSSTHFIFGVTSQTRCTAFLKLHGSGSI